MRSSKKSETLSKFCRTFLHPQIHLQNYKKSLPYRHSSAYLSCFHTSPFNFCLNHNTTQPPRINYPVNRGPQNVGFTNSVSHNSLPVKKTVASISGIVEPPNQEFSRDVLNVISSTVFGASFVSIKPGGSGVVISSFSDSISGAKKDGSPISLVTSNEACSSVLPKGFDTCPEIFSEQSTAASSEKLTSASLLPSSSALSKNMVPDVSLNQSRNKESLSRSIIRRKDSCRIRWLNNLLMWPTNLP